MSAQDTGSEATISVDDELDTLREGIDDPMVLREQLAKEAAARRQLTARAKKAEEDLKAEKLKNIQAESVITPPLESKPYEINDEVVDLRLDGYSKDEVTWIMGNGGRKAIEDPTSYTAIAINAKRDQQRAELAASQTDTGTGLSEAERKYSKEQMAAMSITELEAILPRES